MRQVDSSEDGARSVLLVVALDFGTKRWQTLILA
jgi:hypothetical protein